MYLLKFSEVLENIGRLKKEKELKEIIKAAEKRLEEVKQKTVEKLTKKIFSSKTTHKATKLMAEALLHFKNGVTPKTEKLGYELAGYYYSLCCFEGTVFNYNPEVTFDRENQNYIKKMFTFFSLSDYIYQNTHYDTCENGRFYRMS